MRGNRYRNPLKTPWLVRIAFLTITLAAIFAAFVILQNREIKQGDRIAAAEKTIAQLDKEIEMWEIRIDAQLDWSELERKLNWIESDLADIDPGSIRVLTPEEEVPALPRVANR